MTQRQSEWCHCTMPIGANHQYVQQSAFHMTPYSLVQIYRRFEGVYCLHLSHETLVSLHQTTRRHILEHSILHSPQQQKLRSLLLYEGGTSFLRNDGPSEYQEIFLCKQDHQRLEQTTCRGASDFTSANHIFLKRGLGKQL